MSGLTIPSGKLKWFNAKKRYGFITDDETKKDIFNFDDKNINIIRQYQVDMTLVIFS